MAQIIIDVSQRRAGGNGQVPQCASAAFRMGLALLEGNAP